MARGKRGRSKRLTAAQQLELAQHQGIAARIERTTGRRDSIHHERIAAIEAMQVAEPVVDEAEVINEAKKETTDGTEA